MEKRPIDTTKFGNDDDMEMTSSNGFLAEKFGSIHTAGSKNQDKITAKKSVVASKVPEDDMEMTCPVPKKNLSFKVPTNIEATNDDMEITGAQPLPLAKLVEKKIPLANVDIDETFQDPQELSHEELSTKVAVTQNDMENRPINATNFGNDDDMEITASNGFLVEKL